MDWATVRRCFADEVDVGYSELFGQPGATTAADTLIAGWKEIGDGFESTQHFLGPILVEEGGGRTRLNTHVRAYHRLDGAVWMVAGHYTAGLVRLDSVWKIAALTLRVFLGRGQPCARRPRPRTRSDAPSTDEGMTGDRRVALVTGGNRGLGRETVRQLAARAFTVLLGSRNEADGRAAASSIAHSDVHVVKLDVTSDSDVARCADLVEREHDRRLDVLVNNAAIHYDTQQTALTADFDIVREAFETNVIGAWRLAKMAATFMRPRRYGRIVNVSSGSGALRNLGAGTPGYSVSKLALNGLTLMLADELNGTGILVNAVGRRP